MCMNLLDTEYMNQYFMQQSTSSIGNKHTTFSLLLYPCHLGWNHTKQVKFGIFIVTLPVFRFLLLLHSSSHSQDLGAPGVAIFGIYPQFCLYLSIPPPGRLAYTRPLFFFFFH